MIRNTHSIYRFSLLAAGLAAVWLSPHAVRADEVYFDTISTKRVAREHGAYFGAFGGGASLQGASFQGKLDGLDALDDNGLFVGAEFGYSFKTGLPLQLFTEFEASYLSTAFDADGPISVYRSDLRSINLLLRGTAGEYERFA